MIGLNGNFSLKSNAFLFSSADLVSYGSNLSLILIVRPVLLVKEESKVFYLLSERVDGDDVLIVTVVIVVILHQLFILDMSVLLLDGVELISKSEIVLVSLLDFEDLSLQLRDQKIFLVTSEMNGVVVLKHKNG